MEIDKIYNEDCLEGMKEIPDKSIDCIICDLPYGTTAIAAIKEKRHFIGYEITKEYFDIAQERINAEQSQLKLF